MLFSVRCQSDVLGMQCSGRDGGRKWLLQPSEDSRDQVAVICEQSHEQDDSGSLVNKIAFWNLNKACPCKQQAVNHETNAAAHSNRDASSSNLSAVDPKCEIAITHS